MELHSHSYEHVGKFKRGKQKPVTALITTKKQYKKLCKGKGKKQAPPMLRAHLYRCTGCGELVFIPTSPERPPQSVTCEDMPGH